MTISLKVLCLNKAIIADTMKRAENGNLSKMEMKNFSKVFFHARVNVASIYLVRDGDLVRFDDKFLVV